MALQQAYWNQRQVSVSWTGSFIYATGSPPPRKSTVAYLIHAYSSTIHGHLVWSCGHIMPTIARSSTSRSVRDVELEEKDTEVGEKGKIQLDDLTDRVIVWLT